MESRKTTTSLSIKEDLLKEVRTLAKENNRSISGEMTYRIKKSIEMEKIKQGESMNP